MESLPDTNGTVTLQENRMEVDVKRDSVVPEPETIPQVDEQKDAIEGVLEKVITEVSNENETVPDELTEPPTNTRDAEKEIITNNDSHVIDSFRTIESEFVADVGVATSPCSRSQEEKKAAKQRRVKLVVWNKDRKKWLRKCPDSKQFDDYTFFQIKVPSADDLKHKEKGARTSRCPPDSISNFSKSIKKGRRVQSLKHIDYKKFLQCYIHVQELKNFKVDNLFKGESEGSSSGRRKRNRAGPRLGKADKMASASVEYSSSATGYHEPSTSHSMDDMGQQFDVQMLGIDPSNPEHAFTVDLSGIDDVANFEQVDLVDTFQVTSSPPRRNEYGTTEISFDKDGKPRCTYTDLIERALTETGGLTVSEIYQWISDHYPFFRPDDDRWKNSVRHNLSINPYFKKGEKARSGAGHLWTISEESRALRPSTSDMQRQRELDSDELSMLVQNDTDRAVANILGQYQLAKNSMEGKGSSLLKQQHDGDSLCTPPPPPSSKTRENENVSSEQTGTDGERMDEIPSAIIEYETNGFPCPEYTIDLSQFQFPDSSGLCFDDLMPGGSLIVIQADDQDANKENVHADSTSVNAEYLMNDYSSIRQESLITETERMSGQLISEAMQTHDFDMHKDKSELIQQSEQLCEDGQNQQMCQNVEVQQMETLSEDHAQEYLTLDSIDHLALQEVIRGNHTEPGGLNQYQLMNSTLYEPNFSAEVNP